MGVIDNVSLSDWSDFSLTLQVPGPTYRYHC